MIRLAEADQCTGCGACAAICPKRAIVFKNDEEGFPVPGIQAEICVGCGRCRNVCPAIHKPETNLCREAYAAQFCDRDALALSTSGGLFTAFARAVLEKGGTVYGCVWDDKYNAVLRRADSEEGIKPMRGSKYVWSSMRDAYGQIDEDLKAGRKVLFTGLPCQAAGLKNYLKTDRENLYIITFFCGGAPSPFAFHKYLDTITKKVRHADLDLRFRDKSQYGVGVHITYNKGHRRKYQTYIQNPYFYAYHTKVFHRLCCYHCQYRYRDRVEDITIGDYWGISKYHPEMDAKAGVSVLMVNTEKGSRLLDGVRDELVLVETKEENIAKHNNYTITGDEKTFPIPAFRDAFFAELREKGWKKAEFKYLYDQTRIKGLVRGSIICKPVRWAKRLLRRELDKKRALGIR